MSPTLKSLHSYPVKSLRGIDLTEAQLTLHGLTHDRAWLVIDEAGRFLSQRRLPSMARVSTALSADGLTLSAAGQAPLQVPFEVPDGPLRHTEVWDDPCEVLDEGEAAARWLEAALGTAYRPRLVRMAPDFVRAHKRPDRYGADNTVLFADTAPLLIANQATLDALNTDLTANGHQVVPMDRFRANLVVEGLPPFKEHQLRSLEGPGYRLGLRYPRERCVMITMDQKTGLQPEPGEPFATLRRLNPMPSNPKGPAFGALAVVESGVDARLKPGQILTTAN